MNKTIEAQKDLAEKERDKIRAFLLKRSFDDLPTDLGKSIESICSSELYNWEREIEERKNSLNREIDIVIGTDIDRAFIEAEVNKENENDNT